ncbi:MAG: PHP domain-containing protein [Candidatus Sungbacteria bacterium]|nr:PHP domain-containing protein [Candidatus Sungbacteria bacterium]
MPNTFDLQIQSTASDGKHTPREIVIMAKELGLQTIALTDHDTVSGIAEALAAGAECGVRVIQGIEMSVEEYGAHILGFGVNHENADFLAELQKFKEGRLETAKTMVENLKRAGFAVDWEDVEREKTGEVVARPHLARAVMKRPENKEKLSGVQSVHDFIERFLANDSPNYVKRTAISAKDAIALLHSAGGAAVWSHPAIHFKGNYEELESFLKKLIEWGIDGIEVFNAPHTEDDAEFLQGLAVQYNLLRTAGSDFHEKGDHPADPETGLHSARTLGDYETYGFDTNDIVEKLDQIMKQKIDISGG